MSSKLLPEGYKQTEVGVIPENWDIQQLGEIAIFTNGKAHESDIQDFGKYVVANSKFISTEGEVRKYSNVCHCETHENDILMVMSDIPNGRAIAKCFLVDKDSTYTVNQRICSLKIKEASPKFIFYRLNRNPYYLQFDDGVKQTNLRRDEVLSCPLPIPALPEQRAIATALSDVDALIASLDKLIVKKRHLKTATMQQLLTGKKRLPGFGEGKGYKQTEVGMIPDDWDVKCLKQISPSISVGLVINPSSYFDDEGTIPILVGSQISENHINWEIANRITETSNKSLPASRLKTGDLVTVRVGEPGITAVIPQELDGCNCASMMIIRQHSSFSSLWLCYMMNSQVGKAQIDHVQYGTAQKQFNISDAIDFIYPVPSLLEQRAIATVLSDMDAEISALEARRAKTQAIKQGMMQELLTGRTRLV